MFRTFLFMYRPRFARTIIYMLQAAEYNPAAYLKWFWRTKDFVTVAYRKDLVPTKAARLLLVAFQIGTGAEILASLLLFLQGLSSHSPPEIAYAASLFLITPILWAHLIILPLALGNFFIIKPLYFFRIRASSSVFKNHPGVKIAVAGSYGKTTMKEILLSVLGEGKKVAATPANKNVAISHAVFAEKLKGDEDILIIEYGEGAPGDVARFAKHTHPDEGVITGLAPAHLDRYKTLKRAGQDIFSLDKYAAGKSLYVNGDSKSIAPFLRKKYSIFTAEGMEGWKVKEVKQTIHGLSFSLSNKKETLKIKSRLLGRHQIAPLVLAAYLGSKYGLTNKQIEDGIAKIEPFEHRMKAYQLSGAWIIDDTYNGNIEGMRAGLRLLGELPAKRKIYITPGLVDQGSDERKIHRELGEAIAEANPDRVVLMNHSVTDAIVDGMDGYSGQLVIEEDPLDFYTNLDKFVAAGDLVLMQNDWPDNYS